MFVECLLVVLSKSGSYFGSQYDDSNNVNLDAVCRASTMLARAVYGVALGKDNLEPADIPPSLKADCGDVREPASLVASLLALEVLSSLMTV